MNNFQKIIFNYLFNDGVPKQERLDFFKEHKKELQKISLNDFEENYNIERDTIVNEEERLFQIY